MRKLQFTEGEYYHIYNRGNHKKEIFFSEADYARFLFLVLFFQAPFTIYNISRSVSAFLRKGSFGATKSTIQEITKNKIAELVAFALMPNHFHLVVHERTPNGISRYMQRVQDAYTKSFNTKYQMIGHLFQGPFHAVHIADNEQLLHLSAYIHRNPNELRKWHAKEEKYLWSSYQDYIKNNRWGNLLNPQIILEQYENQREYADFVKTSGTKDILDNDHFIETDTN
ncbi:MAG: putative transposase [Parcubacteria group bacterium Gr01-1014_29]|nr:MAG: putative transposase [Parcubacteria group bacterium Gr01-1014_29]